MLRVNQLARELEVSNLTVIEAAEKLFGSSKSHSSNLTDKAAEEIRRYVRTGSSLFELGQTSAIPHNLGLPGGRSFKVGEPIAWRRGELLRRLHVEGEPHTWTLLSRTALTSETSNSPAPVEHLFLPRKFGSEELADLPIFQWIPLSDVSDTRVGSKSPQPMENPTTGRGYFSGKRVVGARVVSPSTPLTPPVPSTPVALLKEDKSRSIANPPSPNKPKSWLPDGYQIRVREQPPQPSTQAKPTPPQHTKTVESPIEPPTKKKTCPTCGKTFLSEWFSRHTCVPPRPVTPIKRKPKPPKRVPAKSITWVDGECTRCGSPIQIRQGRSFGTCNDCRYSRQGGVPNSRG
jgi:hypothetical protein